MPNEDEELPGYHAAADRPFRSNAWRLVINYITGTSLSKGIYNRLALIMHLEHYLSDYSSVLLKFN